MLHKALTIQLTNNYLATTDDEQHCMHPTDMDILKCLLSTGHYCCLSGGLYPVQRSTYCALALYFNNDSAIKSYCSITVKTITKISFTWLSPNQSSSRECTCPGYTNSKTFDPPLPLIIVPERCSNFRLYFTKPDVNSFTSKIPIALWGYQLDPFMNLSIQLFNFRLVSDFQLTNITKVESNFFLSMLPP